MIKNRAIAHTFYEKEGRKVIWYKRDEENWHKQHNEHEEYRDIDGIKECLDDPDQINKPISGKSRDKRKLIYYKERGNFLSARWHKVVIKCSENWDKNKVSKYKKRATLITTMYVEKINVFNEEKIWP